MDSEINESEEVPIEKKEEIEDYLCIKSNTNETRGIFCEKQFGGKNKNAEVCVNKFCDLCC